jgi:TIR domain
MPTVFLSYRRSDTEGEAGRLADALQNQLGQRFVFRDVVSISPGDRFDAVLEAELDAAKVVLVLIGPAWLEELKKRLAKGDTDYHRLEVATALKGGKRLIPVLLRGAELPRGAALPEDLIILTKCQTIRIRDESWKADVDRLIKAIGRPYRWDLLALRIVIAMVVIILAVWKVAPQFYPGRVSDYSFFRSLVLSLIGVYGLIELSVGYHYLRRLKRVRQNVQENGMPSKRES